MTDAYDNLDVSKSTVIGSEVSLEIGKFFPLRLHPDLAVRVVEKCPENTLLEKVNTSESGSKLL